MIRFSQTPYPVIIQPQTSVEGTELDGITPQRLTYLILRPYPLTESFQSLDEKKLVYIFTSTQIVHKLQPQEAFILCLRDYVRILEVLAEHECEVKDPMPHQVWLMLMQHMDRPRLSSLQIEQRIGSLRWQPLRPYQQVAVQFMIEHQKTYLADEMGSGKTCSALIAAYYFHPQWPLLIICPSSLRFNWKAEAIQWIQISSADILVLTSTKDLTKKKNQSLVKNHKIVIVSFTLAIQETVQKFLLLQKYQVAIVDEAHYTKNMNSQRAKAVEKLLVSTPVKILLSGTPFAYPAEMYQQIRILYPSLYPQFFNYRQPEEPSYAQRYCQPSQVPFFGRAQWIFKGYDHQPELHALLNTFMIRRRKDDILPQLPHKQRTCITMCPLSSKEQKEINELMQKEQKQEEVNRNPYLYMESYRKTCQYKLPHTLRFLEENFVDLLTDTQQKTKILLFYHHQHTQAALQQFMEQHRIPYFIIDGQTAAEKRHEYQQAFQLENQYVVGLLSINAACTGLTLTQAQTVIFAEIPFGSESLQAEDRVHRLGQTANVNIIYLICPDTTDIVNFGLIKKKERESSHILDGEAHLLTSRHVHIQQITSSSSSSSISGEEKKANILETLSSTKRTYTQSSETTPPPKIIYIGRNEE